MTSLILADRYEILTHSPLPELSTATAEAYEARDLKVPESKLYALKTSVFPAPRLSAIDPVFSVSQGNPSLKLVHLMHAANATWGKGVLDRSAALIYQRPGQPVMHSLADIFPPWPEEKIIKKVIFPLYNILQFFRQKEISHHAIRPTNLFYEASSMQSDILVGECLSCPPGYGQNSIFEPLSLALADPISRGEATIAADLFALGVTICFLLNGGAPVNLSDERTIILNRIESGSFATFLPTKQISGTMIDLLRGLLVDADESRWSLKELGGWLTNGKVAQPNPGQPRKASRPISFNGKDDIYTPTILAYEMRCNPIAALEIIDKKDISMWLKNGLNDHSRVHQLEDLKAITPASASASEKLIGVLQILDKGSSFFWQGKSFTGPGLGNCLANAIIRDDLLDGYVRLILSPILSYYLNDVKIRKDKPLDKTFGSQISVIQNMMEYRGMGGGIESCLYSLCQDIPCLSPNLKSYNALNVPDILAGLNLIGMGTDRPDQIIDRHISAFIAVHESTLPHVFFHNMDSANKLKKHIAIIKFLVELQRRCKLNRLQGLAKWVVDLAIPLLSEYKNIRLRQDLEKRLLDLVEAGNLKPIAKLLDNHKLLEADQMGVHKAQAEAEYIKKKAHALIANLNSEEHYSQSIGYNNAMILSTVLSLGFTLFYIFAMVLG